ncbi:MAG: flavodoxin family protein [Bacteroidales bacterium]|nr:flavodoxin family protein [Bacteroidales bacterium]
MTETQSNDTMNRRKFIKKAGAATAGAALLVGGLSALPNCKNIGNTKSHKTMKVLLINGSPHQEGCTFTALSEVAQALNKNLIETEIFHIGTKPVHGCIACHQCNQLGKCVFEDDCANEMAQKMQAADGIIIGSPVYYAAPNGALCALLDRVFFQNGGVFRGKPAAAVVSCRRGGASAAFDRLNKYFTISQMPVVASQYWNAVHGNVPDDVRQDKEGLQIMRTLGNNMAWLLKNLSNAAVPMSEQEAFQRTNFIR